MSVGSGRSESVVIHNFWRTQIVFHARHDPGTACDPEGKGERHRSCGHALPRWRAEKIAEPCRKCYPGGASS